jgi:hypothetical protein
MNRKLFAVTVASICCFSVNAQAIEWPCGDSGFLITLKDPKPACVSKADEVCRGVNAARETACMAAGGTYAEATPSGSGNHCQIRACNGNVGPGWCDALQDPNRDPRYSPLHAVIVANNFDRLTNDVCKSGAGECGEVCIICKDPAPVGAPSGSSRTPEKSSMECLEPGKVCEHGFIWHFTKGCKVLASAGETSNSKSPETEGSPMWE